MKKGNITYKKSGVDYNLLDPVKRMAQKEGLKTAKNLPFGLKEIGQSRGESAYVIESDDCYFAFVEEGLGTKNLVADEVEKITGKSYYQSIAQDTVAAIINDLITVGTRPVTLLAYWAIGDKVWLENKRRMEDLTSGWRKACDLAGVVWGGGETPTLKDVVYPATIDLAGAAFGIIKPKGKIVLGDNLKDGDVIIFFESSGIHANGLTLARKIAGQLPKGFATKLANGKMYGEELLTPTIIYSRLINDLLNKGVDIHYMVNITGHGWRKLMRARKPFTYVIDNVPEMPEIFSFIQKHAHLSDEEMYATFNMGAGFSVYIPQKDTEKVLSISHKHKIKAWVGGRVEKGEKKVVIEPKNIVYNEEDLEIR